jgi:hypothetical protein
VSAGDFQNRRIRKMRSVLGCLRRFAVQHRVSRGSPATPALTQL